MDISKLTKDDVEEMINKKSHLKRKNCPICGLFMRHIKTRTDHLEWMCRRLTYDDYLGGWDHL